MKIVVLSEQQCRSVTLRLSRSALALGVALAVICFGLLVAGSYFWGSHQAGQSQTIVESSLVNRWQQEHQRHDELLAQVRLQTQQQVDALTLRIGQLQAKLLRLDALGQRLTDVADLDKGEFDFSSQPALGGPIESGFQDSYALPELTQLLEALEEQASSREQQLRLLDELIVNQKFEREKFIAGRPIKKGWISSYYGYRSDPFTGKRTWHSGVDFAGKENSPVIAVAGGVVTEVGSNGGYGLLIEINHGSGLVTRYAHCKTAEVSVGDVVQKGQTIARMGSTGRSTGPHVHFEVIKNGKSLNPTKFIRRASR